MSTDGEAQPRDALSRGLLNNTMLDLALGRAFTMRMNLGVCAHSDPPRIASPPVLLYFLRASLPYSRTFVYPLPLPQKT